MKFSVQHFEEFLITIELKIDLEQQKVKQRHTFVEVGNMVNLQILAEILNPLLIRLLRNNYTCENLK